MKNVLYTKEFIISSLIIDCCMVLCFAVIAATVTAMAATVTSDPLVLIQFRDYSFTIAAFCAAVVVS